MNRATPFRGLVCLLLSAAVACGPTAGGGAKNNDGGTDNTEFRALLTDFNTQTVDAVTAVEDVYAAAARLDLAVDAGDDVSVDAALADIITANTRLVGTAAALDQTEYELQRTFDPSAGQQLAGLVAAGLFVAGLVAFGKKMSAWSDDMNAARDARDAAAARVDMNDPDALTDYQNAQREMGDIGAEVITEMTTKIITDQVTGLIPADSIGKVVLLDQAGNKLQDGLKVIFTTDSCKSGYEDPQCGILLTQTKNGGEAIAPPQQDMTVVVAGGADARIVVSPVDVDLGGTTEIVREPIPIDQATPTNVAQNDAGTYVPGANNGTANNGGTNNGVTGGEGTYPDQPWYGIQIEYTVEGGDLGESRVVQDGDANQLLYEMGTLAADKVVISGTITSFNNHSGDPEMDPIAEADILLVNVNSGEQQTLETDSGTVTGTWTQPFRLEIDASGATVVQLTIAGSFHDPSGIKSVVVGASLLNF